MSELEQVELLTGPGAVELLAKALGTEGSQIVSWKVDALHHRPAAGVSAGYQVTVKGAGGSVSEQYVCATTARLTRKDTPGLVRLDHAEGLITVHVWRHPHDPELPALPAACDPVEMSQLIGHQVSASMVAYRPTRRCVVRLDDAKGPAAFVKVVRPKIVADLVGRHEMLAAAGIPAPRVIAQDPAGLVMLSRAAGSPMANFLAAGLPDPDATFDAVVGVLRSLPPVLMNLPRHPAWSDRVEYYAHAAATALPERGADATAIARQVEVMKANSNPGPLAPTHGDYYEANIFMHGPAQVASILDVDSVGPGHQVDDVACLLGHVSVLPHLAPAIYPHVPGMLDRWWNLATQWYDPRALAARAAAVTLSLVAGAKRTEGQSWRVDAEGRLDQAAAWLARVR